MPAKNPYARGRKTKIWSWPTLCRFKAATPCCMVVISHHAAVSNYWEDVNTFPPTGHEIHVQHVAACRSAHRLRRPRLLRLRAGRTVCWSSRLLFICTEVPTERRPVAMETMAVGSWLSCEWGEGWAVADVIEAVMSPLMVHQASMKKASTQQVMILWCVSL